MDFTAPPDNNSMTFVNGIPQPVTFYQPCYADSFAWIRIANALDRIATALEAKNKPFPTEGE